jgi:hypothetical protein
MTERPMGEILRAVRADVEKAQACRGDETELAAALDAAIAGLGEGDHLVRTLSEELARMREGSDRLIERSDRLLARADRAIERADSNGDEDAAAPRDDRFDRYFGVADRREETDAMVGEIVRFLIRSDRAAFARVYALAQAEGRRMAADAAASLRELERRVARREASTDPPARNAPGSS